MIEKDGVFFRPRAPVCEIANVRLAFFRSRLFIASARKKQTKVRCYGTMLFRLSRSYRRENNIAMFPLHFSLIKRTSIFIARLDEKKKTKN